MGLFEVLGELLLEKELREKRGERREKKRGEKERRKEGIGERNSNVTKILGYC